MKRQIRRACFLVSFLSLLSGLSAGQTATTTYNYRIAYATYLGGGAWDQAREVIVYPDGSVLVGAQTSSVDMPVTAGVVQPKYAGDDPALGHGGIYGGDCYLARVSPDGRKILAATYFGGSRQERNTYGMGLDSEGNVVIASATRSPDLPTNERVFQPKYGGPPSDWFVAKLTGDLRRLLWCTYIGGSADESPRGGLTIDDSDFVYLVGGTASPNFPRTQNVYQQKRRGERDAAIVKLKPDGSGIVFSTLLGGGGWDGLMGVRVDGAKNVYVAGHTRSADFPVTAGAPQPKPGGMSDAYFAKLSSDGSRLLYSTYLGGKANEFAEHQPYLAPDGSVLLPGVTASADFPITEGAFQRTLKGTTDGFLTRLSADGKRYVFSTLLGGSGGDFWLMPILDAQGNVIIVGQTQSRDFPVTPNAVQKTYGGGHSDGALAVLSPDGSKLLYATYLGGEAADMIRGVTLGPRGEVYLVGSTASKDFPVTAGAVQARFGGGSGDAYVVKLVPTR